MFTKTLNVRFNESYLPPRCRKPRLREVTGTFEATIPQITSAEAPIAIRATSPFGRSAINRDHQTSNKLMVYRWYNGKLYVMCRKSRFVSLGGKQKNVLAQPKDIYVNDWYPSRELAERTITNKFNSYLLIDDILHCVIGEPRYVVMTFGLGGNHGLGWGTSISVDNSYNSNIHRERYFRIDQEKEANTTGMDIALGRGDTKAVPHFKKRLYERFEILIPESIQLNTQEHGTGDPFINKLNAITQIKNPVVAGLLAVATAFKVG